MTIWKTPPSQQRSMPRQRRLIAGLLSILVALLATSGLVAIAGPHPGGAGLAAVGPIAGETGFPVWYKDTNGVRLELCLEAANPLCGFLPGDVPNPDAPLSVPDNFPEEAFWMLAGAGMDTNNGGRALLTLALEAAFGGGAPASNDQIAFGRVRIWVDNLQPGATYVVTHPYGQQSFVADTADRRGIRFTEDIGIGSFAGPLSSRIGPFLSWDPAVAPAAPAGFIGDPNVEHQVTGSPYGTNIFRIEGPGIGSPGSPFLCPGHEAALDCIETNLFSLQGKLATNAGLDITQALYDRNAQGQTTLNLYASSEADQAIQIKKDPNGYFSTTLAQADGARYYARINTPSLPSTVTLVNAGDVPPTVKSAALIDLVTITRAEYDADSDTLLVEAVSSDQLNGGPTLTLEGFGDLINGEITLGAVAAPPISVTVRSSAGGSDSEQVRVSGAGFAPIPVAAVAGADQSVQQGQAVTLSGALSTPADEITAYAWAQTGGPAVSLTGADTSTASFTAPAESATLTFTLTVQGTGGPASDEVVVQVLNATAPTIVTPANVDAVRNTTVQLDASTSTGVTSYAWTQTGGPAVTLAGAATAQPSFTYPDSATPVQLELTVSGPGGSASQTVTVTPLADSVTIASAQYTRSSAQWRVRGTAGIAGRGNSARIYLGTTCTGTPFATAPVDDLGDWEYRGGGPAATNGARVSVCTTGGARQLNFAVRIR